jgi:N-methylhydantoinase A
MTATSAKRFRIGMDSGGTFTDMVVLDTINRQWSLYKTLSQHENPRAVLHSALEKAAVGVGLPVDELVRQTETFILGTTVATNALLQNRGAKVGVLATRGHEDSLEIREGHKEDGHRYDWEYPQAEMLAPRARRMPITERVLYDGSVLTELDVEDLRNAVSHLKDEGVEAVAVSFLWSFRNPVHERKAAEVVRERLPDAYLSVSHELLPMINEYNRASTVTVNAYVAPVVARFVEGMEAALADAGFDGPVRYFQANGGMSSAQHLVPRAIYALNSGPAAAPTAGAYYAQAYGKDVITVDAGGTSFDIGLVRGDEIDVRLTSDVARYRIGIPMVNIETLGAGGGSIASIDARGLLAVGPRSAESRPGPACYDFGGTEPTVTDALVALGWFNQTALLGGEMPIRSAAAVAAIEAKIAEPLGLTLEEAAEGIVRVVASNMVGGVRRVSIERGYDPRDAVLVAVGGLGPAFACRVADELEIETVVVPRVASGFCAFGAAVSEVKHDYVATYTVEFDELDAGHLNELFESLETRGKEELAAEGAAESTVRRSAEMRYVDQVHNCLVPVASDGRLDGDAIARLRRDFDAKHEELYTYSEPWNKVLLVNIHTSVVGTSAQADGRDGTGGSTFRALSETRVQTGEEAHRDVYLGSTRARVSTPVLNAAQVVVEGTVIGPAVIEETTTTILVEEGWSARLDDRGFYEVKRERGA